MSLIEISNSSSPIDICYSDLIVTQSLQVTGLSNGYLKSNSTVIESTPTIPITDITGFSGAIVTNPLAGNLDADNHDIYHVNQLEALTIDLNGTDLNTRLTTDEANISAKVNKSGDTMTGNLITTNVYPSIGGLNDCGTSSNQWANVNTQYINADGINSKSGGDITLYNDINPNTNNFINFGDSTKYYANIYTENLIPGVNGVGNIGQVGPNRFYNNIYCNNYNSSGTMTLTAGGSGVIPYADSAYPLGGPSNKFTNVYTDAVNLSGTDLTTTLADKFNKTGDTFTGPVVFGLTSSVDFNGQPLNNISNITGVPPTTTITIDKRFAPSIDNTFELGASSNRWSNVYANNAYVSSLIDSTTLLTLGSVAPVVISSKSYSFLKQFSQAYAVTANVFRLANNTSTSVFANGFTNTPGQFRAQYTGTRSRVFKIDLNVSMISPALTQVTIFVSVNGNLVLGSLNSSLQAVTTTSAAFHLSLSDMITLNTNDTVQIGFVSSSTTTITFSAASIRISSELN